MIKVWDIGVRAFHWSLVAAFAVVWLSSDGAGDLHTWAGYVVLGLIAFRLIWGLIGPRYARFSQFMTGPKPAVDYLKQMISGHEPRYIGHNPAGAVMIAALLISLAGTGITGWMMVEPAGVANLSIVGPAYAESEGGDSQRSGAMGVVKDLHGALANLVMLLVVLHIAGVVVASRRHRENLARAMVTGSKRAAGPGDIA